ncbi:hypothetical protein PHLGIDRAFT_501488 [Phlebiopsis gigantea 11061_1 CR5-6]|uniref:Uncharacterized protein n=1 Tax=Phlebiopsis gigantea (strain 11061_1 CR5-6) TaxID=745531 RepID=A0A0C3PBV3_PHLG1|nr:hypothetical protein PHLGIDRAFT_501488 [Phlebiopsis gigantea 11061_1 CR5-6]
MIGWREAETSERSDWLGKTRRLALSLAHGVRVVPLPSVSVASSSPPARRIADISTWWHVRTVKTVGPRCVNASWRDPATGYYSGVLLPLDAASFLRDHYAHLQDATENAQPEHTAPSTPRRHRRLIRHQVREAHIEETLQATPRHRSRRPTNQEGQR